MSRRTIGRILHYAIVGVLALTAATMLFFAAAILWWLFVVVL